MSTCQRLSVLTEFVVRPLVAAVSKILYKNLQIPSYRHTIFTKIIPVWVCGLEFQSLRRASD